MMSVSRKHEMRRAACWAIALAAWLAGVPVTRAQESAAGAEPSPAAVPGAVGEPLDPPVHGPEKPWNRDVPLATRQRASTIFDEGYRFLTIPLFSRAAEKFQEALALYQHPAIYFNLALSQLNLVQPVEAYESFGHAIAHGAEPIGDVPYGQARDYLRRLEQQLGHIEIACEQPGAAVTMDGRPLFTGPGRWQGVVVPGEHQLLASVDGFIPAAERVVVSAGERAKVALALQRPVRTVTERYMPAWVPWAGLGLGAAVLGVGGYVDRQASDALTAFDVDFNGQCPRGCSEIEAPGFDGRLARIGREQTVARGLYIAGGATVMVSAALLYINRERVERRTDDDAISVMPMTVPDALGLTARVRF